MFCWYLYHCRVCTASDHSFLVQISTKWKIFRKNLCTAQMTEIVGISITRASKTTPETSTVTLSSAAKIFRWGQARPEEILSQRHSQKKKHLSEVTSRPTGLKNIYLPTPANPLCPLQWSWRCTEYLLPHHRTNLPPLQPCPAGIPADLLLSHCHYWQTRCLLQGEKAQSCFKSLI